MGDGLRTIHVVTTDETLALGCARRRCRSAGSK
jgi:hypothetical protein